MHLYHTYKIKSKILLCLKDDNFCLSLGLFKHYNRNNQRSKDLHYDDQWLVVSKMAGKFISEI